MKRFTIPALAVLSLVAGCAANRPSASTTTSPRRGTVILSLDDLSPEELAGPASSTPPRDRRNRPTLLDGPVALTVAGGLLGTAMGAGYDKLNGTSGTAEKGLYYGAGAGFVGGMWIYLHERFRRR